MKELLDMGAILFPYKVAKALDPDIYRNIDFDNWVDTLRGNFVIHLLVYETPEMSGCSKCFMNLMGAGVLIGRGRLNYI